MSAEIERKEEMLAMRHTLGFHGSYARCQSIFTFAIRGPEKNRAEYCSLLDPCKAIPLESGTDADLLKTERIREILRQLPEEKYPQ